MAQAAASRTQDGVIGQCLAQAGNPVFRVDAVRAGPGDKMGMIPQQEGNVAHLYQGNQHLAGLEPDRVVFLIQCKLKTGDIAGVECRREGVTE
jgi:hypothetical protein